MYCVFVVQHEVLCCYCNFPLRSCKPRRPSWRAVRVGDCVGSLCSLKHEVGAAAQRRPHCQRSRKGAPTRTGSCSRAQPQLPSKQQRCQQDRPATEPRQQQQREQPHRCIYDRENDSAYEHGQEDAGSGQRRRANLHRPQQPGRCQASGHQPAGAGAGAGRLSPQHSPGHRHSHGSAGQRRPEGWGGEPLRRHWRAAPGPEPRHWRLRLPAGRRAHRHALLRHRLQLLRR